MKPIPTEARRLFIAIPLERHFLETFTRYRDREGKVPYLRWVPERNLHITVLFIGSVTPDELLLISEAVDMVACTMSPFSLTLRKIGYAPPSKPADMVWAYFEQSVFLDVLVHKLYTSVAPICVPQDSYKNNRDHVLPHVTLARFRPDVRTTNLRDLKQTGLESQALVINRIELWESKCSARGSTYTSITTFQLCT